MKAISKIVSLLLLLIFISCQKEINEETLNADPTNPTQNLTSESISNLEKVILDSAFTLQYPVTVLTFSSESQQTSSNSFDNDKDLLTYLQSLNNNNNLVNLKYPVTYLDPDQNTVVFDNSDELNQTAKDIYIPKTNEYLTNDHIAKINTSLTNNSFFMYPLKLSKTIKHLYTGYYQIGTFDIKNSDQFLDFLPKNNGYLVSINYPISVINDNQNNLPTIQINNNTELDEFLTKKESEITGNNLIDRIKYVTRYDGTFDDFVDNSPNLSIEFPYNVTANTHHTIVNSKEELLALRNLYIQELGSIELAESAISLIPSSITKFRFDHLLNNITNFDTYLTIQSSYTQSLSNENRALFSNYSIKYPIDIEVEFEVFSVDNDARLSFYTPKLTEIKYPIELIHTNQTTVVINNNTEFINVIDNN